MAQPAISGTGRSPVSFLASETSIALLTLLVIAALVFISFYQIKPPRAAPSNAAATEFSSERAFTHVEAIAQKPRPVGSPEHDAARDYILKEVTAMGLSPEAQKTFSFSNDRGFAIVGASVENIVVTIPGTDSTKAVMLASHYDSVPTGPGASDDAAAVAALLETMRALRAGPALKNDVIFLFTDAEEIGLLGAKAFAEQRAALKDIGVVLNFEARGNSGPAFMFETSAGNGWLIDEFAKSAPHPVANSLSYEIYKRLPNDTDLTVFKKAGLPGLNFAYITGLNHYHTQIDSADLIDHDSLQHHGSYALALTRHFAGLDLRQTGASNAVYFNLLGLGFIHYSETFVVPLMIFVAALFIGVVVYGLKKKRLTLPGILVGFIAALVSVIVSGAAVTALWMLLEALHPAYLSTPEGGAYNTDLYLMGFAALTVAITATLYVLFRKRVRSENLIVGGLLWWLLLMALTSLAIPGGSYLFTWPLLFSLLALAFLLASKEDRPAGLGQFAALSIGAIPGILLMTPVIFSVYLAMTLAVSAAVVFFIVLLLALLIPQLGLFAAPNKWALPAVAGLVAVALIVTGSLTYKFDKNHRQPNNVFYALNADTGKATWASYDRAPDAWTSQFFNSKVEYGSMSDFMLTSYAGFMKAEAQAAALEAPNIALISDTSADGKRALRLRVTSPRDARMILLLAEPDVEVLATEVEGRRIDNPEGKRWGLAYFAFPKDGLELELELKSSAPVRLRASDVSSGLPEVSGIRPRPEYMMPAPFSYSDSTIVSKSFTF